jgi:hypothetical protein
MADLYQDHLPLPLPHCNRADGRQKLIDSLGTSPTDVVAEGITVYVDYVEQQISECCNGSEPSLMAVLGPNSGDDSNIRVVQLLELVSRVCILLRDLEKQTSLDTLAKQLVTQHKPRILPAASTNDDGAVRDEHHILFACIGWLSMTYIPLTILSGPVLRIVDTSARVSQSKSGANALIPLPQPSGLIQRPLGSMLRRMGLLPLPCPAKPTSQGMEINPYQRYAKEPEMALTVSVLCYYSLRSIGRITVIWTGSLLEHCQLDPTRRELKLFRFPAYCVQQLYTHEPHQNLLLQ